MCIRANKNCKPNFIASATSNVRSQFYNFTKSQHTARTSPICLYFTSYIESILLQPFQTLWLQFKSLLFSNRVANKFNLLCLWDPQSWLKMRNTRSCSKISGYTIGNQMNAYAADSRMLLFISATNSPAKISNFIHLSVYFLFEAYSHAMVLMVLAMVLIWQAGP